MLYKYNSGSIDFEFFTRDIRDIEESFRQSVSREIAGVSGVAEDGGVLYASVFDHHGNGFLVETGYFIEKGEVFEIADTKACILRQEGEYHLIFPDEEVFVRFPSLDDTVGFINNRLWSFVNEDQPIVDEEEVDEDLAKRAALDMESVLFE